MHSNEGCSTLLTEFGDGHYVVPMRPSKLLENWLNREGRKQLWLADRIGVHPSMISHIVTGKRKPTRAQAAKIAEVTGLRIWETCGEEKAEAATAP